MIDAAKNNNVSVVITNDQKLIIWVNDQFTNMTGYTLSEVRGKKPSLLQGRNSEIPAIERIRKSLSEKKPFHDRITNYRKNGEEYTCALTIHPIFNPNGQLSNFVAFEVDNNFHNPNEIELMKLPHIKKHNGLTDSEEMAIFFKLTDYFRTKKPYLNPDLNLNDVAKTLNTNSKYLSSVINHKTKQNFRHFVNQFRVQEFQLIVSTSKLANYTLFSIGQTCGFKNKSTFYSVILSHTGKKPKSIAEIYAN